jgi:tRNA threonylcarbamoyladenosine biosynthesis protein TsaB
MARSESNPQSVGASPDLRILAIETTAFTGSIALLEDDRVIAESRLPDELRSAQSLAPAIESLLANTGWPVSTLNLIAVAQGPGSFTGLRVGVTTTKTLAYAIGAEVMGIDTLEVLAAQAGESPARIHPVLDAQRGQLFTAAFTWSEGQAFPLRQSATAIADLSPWLAGLQRDDVVIGPVLTKLHSQIPDMVVRADSARCDPQAATVGRLAFRDYHAGRRDDLWKLVPHYHRLSAAEEKKPA